VHKCRPLLRLLALAVGTLIYPAIVLTTLTQLNCVDVLLTSQRLRHA
jgi:hypothetical protein